MKKKLILPITALVLLLVIAVTMAYSFGKAVLSLFLVLTGIVFTFLPLMYIGKIIKYDIDVMRKGEKQVGKCTGYERGSNCRFGALTVELKDSSGMARHMKYHALRIRSKYPHDITVYMTDDHSNLGMLTVIREIFYFLFFLAVWLVCLVGTVHMIAEILEI